MRLPAPFYERGDHLAVELPGAHAVFTTRRGGFSTGPYASLNLGVLTGDRQEAVQRNRAALRHQLGVAPVQGRQVHGAVVRRLANRPEDGLRIHEADGQATTLPGVAPMVLVADCLPIALAGIGAVAMIHAGWRGLAAGILREGVRAVRELGATGPLVAAIGPGAGPCCYEVGEEVHAVFAEQANSARRGRNLDLKTLARVQLSEADVRTIHDVELCTICGDPSLHFSHRRDRGVTGRQAGIAWLN